MKNKTSLWGVLGCLIPAGRHRGVNADCHGSLVALPLSPNASEQRYQGSWWEPSIRSLPSN